MELKVEWVEDQELRVVEEKGGKGLATTAPQNCMPLHVLLHVQVPDGQFLLPSKGLSLPGCQRDGDAGPLLHGGGLCCPQGAPAGRAHGL